MVAAPRLDSVDLAAAGDAEALLGPLVASSSWARVSASCSPAPTGGCPLGLAPASAREAPAGALASSESWLAGPCLAGGAVIFGLWVDATVMDIERPSSDGWRSTVAVLRDQLPEPRQQVPPDVGVTHLAAPELDRDLDPVAVLEELDGASDLGIEVALADLRLEADLLEFDRTLVPPGFLLLAGLLVLELPVVEELDDGRDWPWGRPPRGRTPAPARVEGPGAWASRQAGSLPRRRPGHWGHGSSR